MKTFGSRMLEAESKFFSVEAEKFETLTPPKMPTVRFKNVLFGIRDRLFEVLSDVDII